jgi:hypothetical protein
MEALTERRYSHLEEISAHEIGRPDFRLPNMSSAAPGLTQQQLQQLMDDPQMMELGGNLYVAKMFYYLFNFSVTGNGTGFYTVQIDSDADFQWLMTLADYTSKLLTVNVVEGGAGGLGWMSNPLNIDLFAGNAQLPFPSGLIPQLLPKKRVYQFTLVDSSGSTNSGQIALWGFKLYPASQAAQLGAAPSTS